MRRILLVEGDRNVAAGLRRVLLQLPRVSIEDVPDAQSGLHLVRSEPWNLVLSAARLPDGKGVDVLCAALARRPATRRVLLLHSQEDADLLERAINDAHVDYVTRVPWEDAALLARFEELLVEFSTQVSAPSRGRIPPLPGTWPPIRQ